MFTGRVRLTVAACAAITACASIEDSPAFRVALDQCRNDHDSYSADVQIQACTEIFNSPARYTDDLHWLYADRAMAYASRRDYALALADYERALFESPNNAALIFGRGLVQEKMGDRTAALASYDLAIQLAPHIDTLFLGRGRFLLDDDKYDLAIADFDEALRLDPANMDARVARGRAYAGKKVYGLAVKDFDVALRDAPDDVEALFWRGRAHFGANDMPNAIADFTEAMRLAPALTGGGLQWRGRAYVRQKDHDRAIADFDESARLLPERASAHYYRCWGRLAGNRDLETGLAACNIALERDPNYLAARFLGASTSLKLGDAAKALEGFDACAQAAARPSGEDDELEADWGNTGVCLYGRGVARMRLAGMDVARRAEASRDLVVGSAAVPDVAAIFHSLGLDP